MLNIESFKDLLSPAESAIWELLSSQPRLTPIPISDNSQENGIEPNHFRVIISNIRQKLPDISIYSIFSFHHVFLGPKTPKNDFLVLSQLPLNQQELELTSQYPDLFGPLKKAKIIQKNMAVLPVKPQELKLLLAFAQLGINQPFPLDDLLTLIYPDKNVVNLEGKFKTGMVAATACRLNRVLPSPWNIGSKKYYGWKLTNQSIQH